MNNLEILFRYEWKKIWKKKIVWIMGIIVIINFLYSYLLCFLPYETVQMDSNGNPYSVQRGGYEEHVRECENARKLDGRKVDEKLLGEVWKDDENEEYEEIRTLFRSISATGDWKHEIAMGVPAGAGQEELAAEAVKSLQRATGERINSMAGLTAAERKYWLAQDTEVEKPLTYRYAEAWKETLAYVQDVILWIVLLCAVCLSGVFSEERRKKTDALILSSKNGKSPVFFAKLLAGIAFAGFWFLILQGIHVLFYFSFYGVEGFSAQIQLAAPTIPVAITVGQAALLLLGIAVLVSVLISILCTVLSECFGSSIAVLAAVGGGSLLSMLIVVPDHQRVLAQIHDLIPVNLVTVFTFLDYKTISIFGLRLTDLQFAYVLYPLLIVLLLFLGWWKYCRCHAGSR